VTHPDIESEETGLSKLKKIWDNFEGYCCVLTLSAMSLIVFAQILSRFIFHASLSWSEEITRYLLVWTTFFGGAYCVRQGAHVGIEAFTMLLPKKAKKILAIVVMVGTIFLCAVIFKFGINLVTSLFSRNQLSPAMRIPIAYAYLAVPVGVGLFIVRYIQNIIIAIRDFNKNDKPKDDAAETES